MKHIPAVFTSTWVPAGRWKSTNRTAQQEAIRAAAVFLGWPNRARLNAATRDLQLPSPQLLNKWRDLDEKKKKHNWNENHRIVEKKSSKLITEAICVYKVYVKNSAYWLGCCSPQRSKQDCFFFPLLPVCYLPPAPAGFWQWIAMKFIGCIGKTLCTDRMYPRDFDSSLTDLI